MVITNARSSSRRYADNNTKAAQITKAYTATLVFSDLFSHHLLALDDEEFLTLYTTEQTNTALKGGPSSTSNIRTKDIIVALRDSLVETGFEMVANGLLVDIIRRVSLFGVTLLPLDIREESTQHMLAIDAITRYLGVGSYKEWDEEARLSFLMNKISNKLVN